VITVEYHTDLKEVQSDPQLCTLLSAGPQSAPFDRLEWWQGLEQHCGAKPLIVVARDAQQTAVLPLMQSAAGKLEFLANWYNFRTRPIFSPGFDGAALLSTIARSLTDKASQIVLSGIPAEDGSLTLLESAFKAKGWQVFSEVCDTNHILNVNGRSYEEYMADRPGALRTTLKRKAVKVEVQLHREFNPAAWVDYEIIYANSWKPTEGSPAFLRQFAEAEGAAGRLRMAIALAEGRAIAAQFWTVEGGTAYIHKLAHREEAKSLSPGTTLSAALFEQVIDGDRVSLVDFGTGDNPYKRDWMEAQRPRYRLEMYRPGVPGNWPKIAKRIVNRLAGRAQQS
jgi:CelD/BcsL family acetyltransferase involved in cellulose biosynthesis